MSGLTDQELITLLHENGFKATPQRLAICKQVLSSKEHPSADEIYAEVKKEHPTISQATVYKTLSLLKDLGLITELQFNRNHARYDPNITVHVNIICPKCSAIYDYESKNVQEFWKKLILEIGGKISGQRLDVYKICEKCQIK